MSASDDANRADDSRAGGQQPRSIVPASAAGCPGTAALLTFLIGLADILNILRPDLVNRLHRFNSMIPGTLTDVTRSADVLIGLTLLMLAHGLRRRKRRAWQAVAALLAFDIAIHFIHTQRIVTAVISLVLLIALLYFRDEFYAEGDPRTRWRAMWCSSA
jgi:lysyl-tRNA synthetase class 2